VKKGVVHVVRNPLGWWDIRADSGEVLSRYISEFHAREAGRMAAEQVQADLAIHQDHQSDAVMYEVFDDLTKKLRSHG
jgi:hypothetical protein